MTQERKRIAGTLKRIDPAIRANGMPGYKLLIGGELLGPLAPHHEVIVGCSGTRT
ncbi:hypothetical protein [Rathayibacter sp. PhB151]|uniref:hypothetical protein n=1 Tax=Rathayibacter sp. PhB151 TaxID=2485189 RepID=UPI001417024F|nr:hypothetical protein [Rathayibacter sp. PhB151]